MSKLHIKFFISPYPTPQTQTSMEMYKKTKQKSIAGCVYILIDPYFAVGKLRILSEKESIRRMVETSEKHFRFLVWGISLLSLSLSSLHSPRPYRLFYS